MRSNVQNYDRCFKRLDFFFFLTGERLTAKKPRNIGIGLLTNWTIYSTISVAIFFLYMLLLEYNNIFMTIQQTWGIMALLQISIRYINRATHWEDKENLIAWSRDIHVRKSCPEYEPIFDEHLKKTNHQLSLTLK